MFITNWDFSQRQLAKCEAKVWKIVVKSVERFSQSRAGKLHRAEMYEVDKLSEVDNGSPSVEDTSVEDKNVVVVIVLFSLVSLSRSPLSTTHMMCSYPKNMYITLLFKAWNISSRL